MSNRKRGISCGPTLAYTHLCVHIRSYGRHRPSFPHLSHLRLVSTFTGSRSRQNTQPGLLEQVKELGGHCCARSHGLDIRKGC